MFFKQKTAYEVRISDWSSYVCSSDRRKRIPLTYWAMMAGTLAITGVGIACVAGFAGFYSKDGILEAAFAAGGGGQVAFWVGTFVALLTSFYSWRDRKSLV